MHFLRLYLTSLKTEIWTMENRGNKTHRNRSPRAGSGSIFTDADCRSGPASIWCGTTTLWKRITDRKIEFACFDLPLEKQCVGNSLLNNLTCDEYPPVGWEVAGQLLGYLPEDPLPAHKQRASGPLRNLEVERLQEPLDRSVLQERN